jgi:hypothetical protein
MVYASHLYLSRTKDNQKHDNWCNWQGVMWKSGFEILENREAISKRPQAQAFAQSGASRRPSGLQPRANLQLPLEY